MLNYTFHDEQPFHLIILYNRMAIIVDVHHVTFTLNLILFLKKVKVSFDPSDYI